MPTEITKKMGNKREHERRQPWGSDQAIWWQNYVVSRSLRPLRVSLSFFPPTSSRLRTPVGRVRNRRYSAPGEGGEMSRHTGEKAVKALKGETNVTKLFRWDSRVHDR